MAANTIERDKNAVDWCLQLNDKMYEFYLSKLFCDVHFSTADGKTIMAHACVLAAGSPKLQHDFQMDSNPYIIDTNITAAVLKRILSFLYTGQFPESDNFDELVAGAKELHIRPLLSQLYRKQGNQIICGSSIQNQTNSTEETVATTATNMNDGKIESENRLLENQAKLKTNLAEVKVAQRELKEQLVQIKRTHSRLKSKEEEITRKSGSEESDDIAKNDDSNAEEDNEANIEENTDGNVSKDTVSCVDDENAMDYDEVAEENSDSSIVADDKSIGHVSADENGAISVTEENVVSKDIQSDVDEEPMLKDTDVTEITSSTDEAEEEIVGNENSDKAIIDVDPKSLAQNMKTTIHLESGTVVKVCRMMVKRALLVVDTESVYENLMSDFKHKDKYDIYCICKTTVKRTPFAVIKINKELSIFECLNCNMKLKDNPYAHKSAMLQHNAEKCMEYYYKKGCSALQDIEFCFVCKKCNSVVLEADDLKQDEKCCNCDYDADTSSPKSEKVRSELNTDDQDDNSETEDMDTCKDNSDTLGREKLVDCIDDDNTGRLDEEKLVDCIEDETVTEEDGKINVKKEDGKVIVKKEKDEHDKEFLHTTMCGFYNGTRYTFNVKTCVKMIDVSNVIDLDLEHHVFTCTFGELNSDLERSMKIAYVGKEIESTKIALLQLHLDSRMKQIYQCPKCSLIMKKRITAEEHKCPVNILSTGKKTACTVLSCSLCDDKLFMNMVVAKNHFIKHCLDHTEDISKVIDNKEENVEKSKEESDVVTQIDCKIELEEGEKKFIEGTNSKEKVVTNARESDPKKEMKDDIPEEHLCQICSESFVTTGNLRSHAKKVHGDNLKEALGVYFEVDGIMTKTCKNAICQICKEVVEYSDFRYNDHVWMHHNQRTAPSWNPTYVSEKCQFLECDICHDFRTCFTSSLGNHKMSHQQSRRGQYMCNVCGMAFRSGGTLQLHELKHTVQQNFVQCPSCLQIFNTKSELKKHQQQCSHVVDTDSLKSNTSAAKSQKRITLSCPMCSEFKTTSLRNLRTHFVDIHLSGLGVFYKAKPAHKSLFDESIKKPSVVPDDSALPPKMKKKASGEGIIDAKYICTVCHFGFYDISMWRSHIINKHGISNWMEMCEFLNTSTEVKQNCHDSWEDICDYVKQNESAKEESVDRPAEQYQYTEKPEKPKIEKPKPKSKTKRVFESDDEDYEPKPRKRARPPGKRKVKSPKKFRMRSHSPEPDDFPSDDAFSSNLEWYTEDGTLLTTKPTIDFSKLPYTLDGVDNDTLSALYQSWADCEFQCPIKDCPWKSNLRRKYDFALEMPRETATDGIREHWLTTHMNPGHNVTFRCYATDNDSGEIMQCQAEFKRSGELGDHLDEAHPDMDNKTKFSMIRQALNEYGSLLKDKRHTKFLPLWECKIDKVMAVLNQHKAKVDEENKRDKKAVETADERHGSMDEKADRKKPKQKQAMKSSLSFPVHKQKVAGKVIKKKKSSTVKDVLESYWKKETELQKLLTGAASNLDDTSRNAIMETALKERRQEILSQEASSKSVAHGRSNDNGNNSGPPPLIRGLSISKTSIPSKSVMRSPPPLSKAMTSVVNPPTTSLLNPPIKMESGIFEPSSTAKVVSPVKNPTGVVPVALYASQTGKKLVSMPSSSTSTVTSYKAFPERRVIVSSHPGRPAYGSTVTIAGTKSSPPKTVTIVNPNTSSRPISKVVQFPKVIPISMQPKTTQHVRIINSSGSNISTATKSVTLNHQVRPILTPGKAYIITNRTSSASNLHPIRVVNRAPQLVSQGQRALPVSQILAQKHANQKQQAQIQQGDPSTSKPIVITPEPAKPIVINSSNVSHVMTSQGQILTLHQSALQPSVDPFIAAAQTFGAGATPIVSSVVKPGASSSSSGNVVSISDEEDIKPTVIEPDQAEVVEPLCVINID